MTEAMAKVNGTNGSGSAYEAPRPVATMALAPRSFDEAKAQASALAQADGFVPRSALGKPAAVLAALMTGAELGIGPMEALRSIHVIEGKPTLSAEFMLARAIRAGVVHQWLRIDATEARVRLTRPGFQPMELGFTMAEAEAAGVTRKDNWRKYPAAMLRARCISAALRAYCPDVLGAGLYTAEEMGADTDEAGEPVIVERAPARAVDAAPRGEPSAESGEAGCGGSCGEASEPTSTASAPKRLDECDTVEAVGAWIAVNAAKLRSKPDEVREKVTARAWAIANAGGLSPDDAAALVNDAQQTLEAALAA